MTIEAAKLSLEGWPACAKFANTYKFRNASWRGPMNCQRAPSYFFCDPFLLFIIFTFVGVSSIFASSSLAMSPLVFAT